MVNRKTNATEQKLRLILRYDFNFRKITFLWIFTKSIFIFCSHRKKIIYNSIVSNVIRFFFGILSNLVQQIMKRKDSNTYRFMARFIVRKYLDFLGRDSSLMTSLKYFEMRTYFLAGVCSSAAAWNFFFHVPRERDQRNTTSSS